uniref:Uncharacterized protein n=1 Tax=Calcidiscus leptoporus TaxID=127549 RepID=A0A7S0ILY4_9EUKA
MTAAACGQHSLLASASADQTVRLWRLSAATPECLHRAELGAPLTCVALHPDHRALYAGGTDGRVCAVPLLSTEQRGSDHAVGAASHLAAVCALLAAEDGRRLYSCAGEGGVWVWDAARLLLLQRLMPQQHIDRLLLLPCPAAFLAEGHVPRLAPLKKFATSGVDAGALSADDALGCVPVHLPRDALATGLDGAAGELPLLREAVHACPLLGVGAAAYELDAAEESAGIGTLRAQLSQWRQINTELFALACERQLASAP